MHLLGGYGLPAPLGKLCVCALDVVAARNMVAGTQAVIDAGGGVIVGLGHAALFHNRVGQRDGRQQAPGVAGTSACWLSVSAWNASLATVISSLESKVTSPIASI